MFSSSNPNEWTAEDERGITVKIGDTIARAYGDSSSSHLRIGEVTGFKRIPQDSGPANHYVLVKWFDWSASWVKTSKIYVDPPKNGDFVIIELPMI